MKLKHTTLIGITALTTCFFSAVTMADINRVRVINESNTTIYVHVGGYAPSSRLDPGQWKIYYYPFKAHLPSQHGKTVNTSLLVATAGGHWVTAPDGYTYLRKPQMTICLDYKNKEHQNKTGNRVWTIKQAYGFDKDCAIKRYKKPSHGEESSGSYSGSKSNN